MPQQLARPNNIQMNSTMNRGFKQPMLTTTRNMGQQDVNYGQPGAFQYPNSTKNRQHHVLIGTD